MSLSLRDYSALVRKNISLVQHDVEPQYLPNLREIRQGSQYCLDLLHVNLSNALKRGGIPSHPGLSRVLQESFSELMKNVRRHQQWSFWHYTLVCVITAFPYAEMVKNGEQAKLPLDSQKTWDNADDRVATVFFNFVAGQLYPKALPEIIKSHQLDTVFTRNESTTERYDFFCRFLLRQIKLVTGELNEQA